MLSGILETDSKCIDIDFLNVVLKMNWMARAQIKPTTTTCTTTSFCKGKYDLVVC